MAATSTSATLPMIHRILGVGLLAGAATFLGLRYFGIGSIPDGNTSRTVAYALAGIAMVLTGIAVFVFRPRVPRRSPAESVDQFWSRSDVAAKMLQIWFYLEGAGTLAAAGYMLTGDLLTAIAACLAIAAYWWSGPNPFADVS
jgi:hypothetical protein